MTNHPPITIDDIRREGSDLYGHARWVLAWLTDAFRPRRRRGRPPGTDYLEDFKSNDEFVAWSDRTTRAAGRRLTMTDLAKALGYTDRSGLDRALRKRAWGPPSR